METVYFLLSFAVNLKLLCKIMCVKNKTSTVKNKTKQNNQSMGKRREQIFHQKVDRRQINK